MDKLCRSESVLDNIATHLPKSCLVTLTSTNGSTFSGVLHSFDKRAGKIILKNVSTAGAKLFGTQIFYCTDVVDFQFMSDLDTGDSNSPIKGRRAKGKVEHKKDPPQHLKKLVSLDTDDLIMSNIFSWKPGDEVIGRSEEDYEDFYETDNYTVICRVSEKFHEAMEYIMRQEVIGVAVNGQKLGRDGTLSLIQVATDSELIVFDTLRLGEEGFKEGLQAMFESDSVMKVMHDCRWIADLLKYQYIIAMENIFDTQVACAFVYRSHNNGDWPRYVESLPGCLVNYLGISPVHVVSMKMRERSREQDEAVWLQRPLPEKLLEAATKNTVHLIRLHRTLISDMLVEFKAAVGIYLNHLSDSAIDLETSRVNAHLLPEAFKSIYEIIKQATPQQRGIVTYDQKGFRENDITPHSTDIVFSHDSAWHLPYHSHYQRVGKKFSTRSAESAPKMTSGPAEFRGKPSQQNLSTISSHTPEAKSKEPVSSQADPLSPRKAVSLGLGRGRFFDGCERGSKPNAVTQDSEISPVATAKPSLVSPRLTVSLSTEDAASSETAVGGTKNPLSPHSGSENTNSSSEVKKSGSSLIEKFKLLKNEFDKGRVGMPVGKIERDNSSSCLQSVEKDRLQNGDHQPSRQNKHHNEEQQNCTAANLGQLQLDDLKLSAEDLKQAKELQRRMAIFNQPTRFVPAFPQSKESPSSCSSQAAATPTALAMPPLVPQVGSESSDSEGSMSFSEFMKSQLKQEDAEKNCSLIPAGMNEPAKSKKAGKSLQQNSKLGSKGAACSDGVTPPHNPPSEDFSAIPTARSLSKVETHPLGVSPIGIGDPFSEDEGFSTPGEAGGAASRLLRPFRLTGPYGDEAITDDELNKRIESEKCQQILKLASSLQPVGNVRDKLLPAKVMKSPPAGSLDI